MSYRLVFSLIAAAVFTKSIGQHTCDLIREDGLEHLSLFLNSAKPHILDEDASHAQGAGPIPTIALPRLRVAEIALCEDDADIFLSIALPPPPLPLPLRGRAVPWCSPY